MMIERHDRLNAIGHIKRVGDRSRYRSIAYRKSTITNRQSSGFTLIEILVVLGIIALVTAMSLPLIVPFMKGRTLDQATDMIKNACLQARGRAIKERKRFCVVILESERKVYVCDYEQLRYVLPVIEISTAGSGSDVETVGPPYIPPTFQRSAGTGDLTGYYLTMTSGATTGFNSLITGIDSGDPTILELDEDWPGAELPSDGDTYLIGGLGSGNIVKYLTPHYIGNYADEAQRVRVLDQIAVVRPRILPEGCRLDLDRDGSDPNVAEAQGWTYVFLPTGGIVTLDTEAQNEKDAHWSETTFREADEFTGPRIYGPQDGQVADIIGYAMTGQVVSE